MLVLLHCEDRLLAWRGDAVDAITMGRAAEASARHDTCVYSSSSSSTDVRGPSWTSRSHLDRSEAPPASERGFLLDALLQARLALVTRVVRLSVLPLGFVLRKAHAATLHHLGAVLQAQGDEGPCQEAVRWAHRMHEEGFQDVLDAALTKEM